MIKMVILLATVVGAIASVVYLIDASGQTKVFMEWEPFVFVFTGGIFLALSVTEDHDKLSVQRLEAFRHGCTLFGVIGTLIGFIAIGVSMDNPIELGLALAVALLTLFWAAALNYIAKLVIISKSSGG